MMYKMLAKQNKFIPITICQLFKIFAINCLLLYIELLVESLATGNNLSYGCRNSDVNIIISTPSRCPFRRWYYLCKFFK